MKYLLIVLAGSWFCTMQGVKEVADAFVLPSYIKVKQGVLMASVHGELEYTVMHDTKNDTYAGVFLNRNFLVEKWVSRSMDERIAKFYFNRVSTPCHGCKSKKVAIRSGLCEED